MKLWLDDNRPPWKHGRLGWDWAQSYDEAVEMLRKGRVTQCSLDHDLTERATLGDWDGELTGFEVVCWMRDNHVWPRDGVEVHSVSEPGRRRMLEILESCCPVPFSARDLYR